MKTISCTATLVFLDDDHHIYLRMFNPKVEIVPWYGATINGYVSLGQERSEELEKAFQAHQ